MTCVQSHSLKVEPGCEHNRLNPEVLLISTISTDGDLLWYLIDFTKSFLPRIRLIFIMPLLIC